MEKWDKVMAVNLRGAMLSYKYAAMQMIRQGRGGRIIGEHFAKPVSVTQTQVIRRRVVDRWETRSESRSGHTNTRDCIFLSRIVGMNGGASAYAASKFGVRGLTQCAGERVSVSSSANIARRTHTRPALELAKHKITVNAYAPGVINTSMCTVPHETVLTISRLTPGS